MQIGIPREIKNGERRVALTPPAVAALQQRGHHLMVETKAGMGAGFSDAEYIAAGAAIVADAAAAFDADLVVKVKEIQTDEWRHLRPGSALCCFLHLNDDPVMTAALLMRRITAIAFETIRDTRHQLPILAPMSAIAGRLAVTISANLLMVPNGGRGVAIEDARVVIVGAGNAGAAAAKTARALGADVTVLAPMGARLAALAVRLGPAHAIAITHESLTAAIAGADLVIGAVNVPGSRTPKLLTREHLRAMGRGAVLVEICIDGGGMCETARATSHTEPTYIDEGVIHYCVPNMPAAVPHSATLALSNALLPYVTALADKGVRAALQADAGLRAGLHMYAGELVHAGTACALHLACTDALDALARG